MALELTFSDHYDLTYQFVSHKTILIGNSSGVSFFEEFRTKNLRVATILDKDAVWLHKLFVPQEQIVFVSVLDRTI